MQANTQSQYLIQQEELLNATGYTSAGHLKRHLDSKQIWYDIGRNGRIYTTPAAYQAVLRADQIEEILFDGS